MKYLPLFFLSFFIFFIQNSFCQGFKKGYIITLTNDTLPGLLLDEHYEVLSRQVGFKANRQRKQITYFSPKDIKGFAFKDGDFFQSFEIEYSYPDKKGNKVDVAESRFLHRIEAGKISLFELEDDYMKPLYIQKSEDPPILLCQTYYLKNLNTQTEDFLEFEIPENLNLRKQEVKEILEKYNAGLRTDFKTKQIVNKPLSIWANLSLPISDNINRYAGLGFGSSVEVSPFSKSMAEDISIGLGFRKLDLKRDDGRRDEQSIDIALRLNYHLNNPGKLAPYVFVETVYTQLRSIKRYRSNNDTNDLITYQDRITREVFPHFGAGVQVNLNRHLLRFEVIPTKKLFVQIGYGYSIFK